MTSPIRPTPMPWEPGYEEYMAEKRQNSMRFWNAVLLVLTGVVGLGLGAWWLAEKMGVIGWWGMAAGYVLSGLAIQVYQLSRYDDEPMRWPDFVRLAVLLPLLVAIWPFVAVVFVEDLMS